MKHRAIILRPGTWNDKIYTSTEIERAFKKLPDTLPIFEDFKSELSHLVGIASDFKYDKGIISAEIYLDINPNFTKVIKGFGIAPKIKGKCSQEKEIKDFRIDELSLVVKPCYKNLKDFPNRK